MKISEIFSQSNGPVVSFEIFPPKRKKNQSKEDFDSLLKTIDNLARLKPDFISVTYGAGGTNSDGSLEISEYVKNKGITSLPHFTSIGYPVEEINSYLGTIYNKGFENILALRGDLPKSPSKADLVWRDFLHATDLIKVISRDFPNFCIGGAAYPEGHQESSYAGQDIEIMKIKEKMGVKFFLTQLFFNNDNFFKFMENVRNNGVESPVSAGVMPLISPKYVDKIIELSGVKLPKELENALENYRDDEVEFRKRSLDYCVRQVNDLFERGVDGVHLYTMNRHEAVEEILDQVDSNVNREVELSKQT
ncbi:methylenetetrahydrofolate reductase [Natranaerobius thermophilus]|uniref:Methylenetetrahydrofolate reductase n=1 Tax=Natranaerobius thermophilus (strain ATCC BAA-1301 / DSM 18059 / JW/NM-WN-LF) TaxID=457570 RepID=B2A780_NATTJ|nr:methylenetetrahydrofolate reductase [Natranaerobius thermophilus]ACB84274.1 Methylenetetrahydrofolate reductase (NAD(P)H) [Natranaerobius thermophilus JW/NM-WN-LF]